MIPPFDFIDACDSIAASSSGASTPHHQRQHRRPRPTPAGPERTVPMNSTVLFVIAAILVIVGIVQLFQGQIILGVVLIVAGLLVGPGGYSLFRGRHA
jgi:hypothetical protein